MLLSGIILSCFITLVVLLVWKHVWEYLRKVRVMLQLKGPKALPFIGNVLLINDHKFLVNIGSNGYKKYGPIMRIWISFMPVFVLFDPNYVHKVLSDAKHNNKNFFYHLLNNFIGDGLITSEGSTWRNHRRLLSPLFHTNYLKKFVTSFAENAEHLVNEMLDNQGDINVTSFCNKCVFHTLTRNVLGLKDINMESSPYRKCQVQVAKRVSKPWLLIDWIFKVTKAAKAELDHKDELYNYTQKVIEEKMIPDKKSSLDSDEDEFSSFVNFMLDVNKKHPDMFTIKDIIDEACTFTLAGQESVASAAAFAMHLLATHPEIQAKCREEVDSLSEETLYSFEGLRELTFLENCIKETLRLFPSLPIIGRRLGCDLKLDKDLILPAGSQIVIAPYVTHRIPDLFPDPEEFRPERFEEYPSGCKNPYAYIPFSSGLRKCIGYQYSMLELKCILAALLRRFILEPTGRPKTPNLAYRITLRAKGGLWVRFRPREGIK